MFKLSKLKKLIAGISFVFISVNSFATSSQESVYINRDSIETVDTTMMPYLAFNPTTTFDKENYRIFLNIDDTLYINLINNDSIPHGFDIRHLTGYDVIIPAGDSSLIELTFEDPGAFIYYDHTNQEAYRYMGLGGMIVVKDPAENHASFFWNMKDHQKQYNENLNENITVDWSTYYPDYFTINGNSNPHINEDTMARVTGNLGDTIKVYMVNTGQSAHSIHFHGYHSTIIQSSASPHHEGRFKDTFGVYSMELVVIEFVANQLGEYPVHDHNLVAVSGGGIYPNGMFLTILIE
jgi:FtsP/CotA-like multicopper oxidase with cupredoxin domain